MAETSTGTLLSFWEWRTARTVSMFGIGPAMFPRATAKRVCLEVKLPTHFSRVSRRRPIWRESLMRHLLTRIWPLFSEVAPVFRRLAQSAGCSGVPLKHIVQRNNSGGAAAECACLWNVLLLKRGHGTGHPQKPWSRFPASPGKADRSEQTRLTYTRRSGNVAGCLNN